MELIATNNKSMKRLEITVTLIDHKKYSHCLLIDKDVYVSGNLVRFSCYMTT